MLLPQNTILQYDLRGTGWFVLCWIYDTATIGSTMREKNSDSTARMHHDHAERDEVLRLMTESGDPAPIDMALFSRQIGRIIVQARATDKRN